MPRLITGDTSVGVMTSGYEPSKGTTRAVHMAQSTLWLQDLMLVDLIDTQGAVADANLQR